MFAPFRPASIALICRIRASSFCLSVLLLCGASLGGCASTHSSLALPKAGSLTPANFTREPSASEKAFWDRLAEAKVIYIGETHNSNADHEYQFDVLKGLRARGEAYAIGWEMFEVPQQPLLDQWHSKQISTETLLEKTDWRTGWGSMSVMYETILRWSRTEDISSVALNAPRSLSHKLARGLPLTAEERAMLPTGFRPLPGGLEHFAEQMNQNPHAGMSGGAENFYRAQLLWDQTMASRVVAFTESHPDAKLVVLTGRGHLEGGFGIPAFVRQKTNAQQIVLFPGGSTDSAHPGSIAKRSKFRDQPPAQRAFFAYNSPLFNP